MSLPTMGFANALFWQIEAGKLFSVRHERFES